MKHYFLASSSDEGAGVPDYAIGKLTDRFYALSKPNSPLKKEHMPGCHPTASRTAAKAVSSSFEMMRTI